MIREESVQHLSSVCSSIKWTHLEKPLRTPISRYLRDVAMCLTNWKSMLRSVAICVMLLCVLQAGSLCFDQWLSAWCCYVSYELEVSISSMNWDWVPQPLKLKQPYPFERNWRIWCRPPPRKNSKLNKLKLISLKISLHKSLQRLFWAPRLGPVLLSRTLLRSDLRGRASGQQGVQWSAIVTMYHNVFDNVSQWSAYSNLICPCNCLT